MAEFGTLDYNGMYESMGRPKVDFNDLGPRPAAGVAGAAAPTSELAAANRAARAARLAGSGGAELLAKMEAAGAAPSLAEVAPNLVKPVTPTNISPSPSVPAWFAKGAPRFMAKALGPIAGVAAGAYDLATGGYNPANGPFPTDDKYLAGVVGGVANAVVKAVDPMLGGALGVTRAAYDKVKPMLPVSLGGTTPAAQPVETPMPTPYVTYNGLDTPAEVPAAQAVAAPVAPQYRSSVPYTPITSTRDENGNVVITGSGQSQDYLAAQAAAPVYKPATGAAGFFGASARLKQIAGDNANKIATVKAANDATAKGANAAKDLAAAHISAASLSLAKRMEAEGRPAAEIAAALHGRVAGDKGVIVPDAIQPLPSAGGVKSVVTVDRATGAAKRVAINDLTKVSTIEAAIVDAKRNGKSWANDPARVRKEAEALGYRITN